MFKVFFIIFIYEILILLIISLIKNLIIKYKINKAIINMNNIEKLKNKKTLKEEIEEAEKIIDNYKEI